MAVVKREMELSPGDLARLLRQLAEAVEKGGQATGLASGLAPELSAGLDGFELAAHWKDGAWRAKLKAEPGHAGPASVPASVPATVPGPASAKGKPGDGFERAREKYRQLKKAMQADFNRLSRAAQAGEQPAPELAESFLALAEAMRDMPQPLRRQAGAEAAELARANQAFWEDAQAVRGAIAARDTAALARALERLARRKTACHAQYR